VEPGTQTSSDGRKPDQEKNGWEGDILEVCCWQSLLKNQTASGRLRIPHFVSGGGRVHPNAATNRAGGLFSSKAGELPSLKLQLAYYQQL